MSLADGAVATARGPMVWLRDIRSRFTRAASAFNAGIPQGKAPVAVVYLPTKGATPSLAALAAGKPIRGEPPAVYKNSGTNVRLIGFQQHPVVQACMRAIVDVGGSVPINAYRDSETRDQPLANHPAQKLMDRPWVGMNGGRLRNQTILDFITYGNALWRLNRQRPSGPPVEMKRINPEGLQVVYADSDGMPLQYVYSDTFGRLQSPGAQDIVHFRDLAIQPPHMPDIFGYPRAASALSSIASDNEATQYVRQIVTNDGTPTFVVLMHDEVEQAQAEAAQEQWQEGVVERGNRGRAAFMAGVKEVKPLGFNLRNLEFPDLRRVTREDVCASLGVDPRIVGISSATNDGGLSGVQYAEARTRLVQHTIEPLLHTIEAELNHWLAPEFGDVYLGFDPNVLADIVEDDKETSERIRAEFGMGLRTWEESRTRLKLPERPAPLDAIWLPAGGQLVPAAVAVIDPTDVPEEEVPEPPAGQPTPTATDGPKGSAPGEAPPAPAAPAQEKSQARGVVLTKEQRRMLWQQADERATKREAPFKRAALQIFDEERTSVAAIFHTQAIAADAHRNFLDRAGKDDPYIDAALRRIRANYKGQGAYHQTWLDRYRALIGETYAVGGNHLADAKGGVTFMLESPAVQAAIQARNERLAEYVTKTTSDQVTAAIAAGRKAGMGIRDISKLVDKTVFGGQAAMRSTRIARTETIGSMSQGEYDTARDSGAIQSKEWLTQGDDRVRDSHYDLDGQRVNMSEKFGNGLQHPGDQAGDASETINCYLPGTLVRGDFIAGMRSPYSGPAVEVVTRSGQRLSLTPNHPVMTAEGFRPAGTLRHGDQLLADRIVVDGRGAADANDHQGPSAIEDVFAALSKLATPRLVHLAADDFHGDAAHVNGEVEIVRPDSFLLSDTNAASREYGRDISLVTKDPSEPVHVGDGSSHLPLHGVGLAAASEPGASALAFDGSAVCLDDGPLQALRIGPPSDMDAAFLEAASQGRPGDSRAIAERLERFSALVARDEVVQVRHFEFTGHVYDLTSVSGLMIAGNIVNSNCRCNCLFYDEPAEE